MPDNHIGVEPLRTDPTDTGPLSDAERAARIEQLLLSGLDHYFGGNYEQAINVWTRVAFLERGHGRARAYIERARGALAERQRESEESLHQGLAAYHAGDLQRARDLLTRAVELGGANETALLFLQRHAGRHTGLLPADLYFRRTMWLIVFGLVNAYLLLWPGDILYYYGVVGLLLFVFRNVAPRKLIVAATVIMILQTAVTVTEWAEYQQASAAAAVVLPMPISPPTSRSQPKVRARRMLSRPASRQITA